MTWARRIIFAAAVGWLVYALAVWAPSTANGDLVAPTTSTVAAPPGAAAGAATVDGHDVRWWARRARRNGSLARSERRTLLHHPNVSEALDLACTVYGNCATLWRRARCESKLYRFAASTRSSARGLLQFLTTGWVRRYGDHVRVNGGTWATTPFWRFSPFSAYANALAAGWMTANGRGGEWQCR